MTAYRPGSDEEKANGKNGGIALRLPRWTAEFVALFLVTAVTYMATHFMDTALANQRMADRMDASEKDRASIHEELRTLDTEQKLNSQFREASKARLEELDDIKNLIIEHMSEEDHRWKRIAPKKLE